MDLERPTMRPLALVTGASSGIGLELAKQFAKNGFDLLITARESDLEGPRDVLMDLGADVSLFHADLSRWSGVEKLHHQIQEINRPLEVAAIIAGSGPSDPFLETDLKDELELIRLNIMSAVHLTKLILSSMVEEESGKILFTSSSKPIEVVDAASKAFLISFAESLRNELKDTGVTVTALLPSSKDSAEEFARKGFIALMKERDLKTRMANVTFKIMPEWAKAYVHRSLSVSGTIEEKAL